MRRILVLLAAIAASLGLWAPGASADSTLCNYGHVVSDVAKAPGPASDFTGFSFPYTINRNNQNIPGNPNGELLLCQFQ